MDITALIFFVIFSAYVLTTLVDLLFTPEQQESVKRALESFQGQILREPSEWLIVYPFHRTSLILDKLFGQSLFSWRMFISISLLSVLLAISSILFLNIIQRGDNAKELAPWRIFSKSLENLPDKIEVGTDNQNEISEEINDKLNERNKYLKTFNTLHWKIIYTVVYILLCSIIAAISSMISVATTRRFLREIVKTKGIFTFLGCLLLNLVLLLIFSLLLTSSITFFSMPGLWAGSDLFFQISQAGFWGSAISALLIILLSIFGWFVVIAGWIKVIIIISLMPWFILIILLVLGILCTLLKRPIHFSVLTFVRKSLTSRIGPIGFVATIFSLLTAIVGYLAY